MDSRDTSIKHVFFADGEPLMCFQQADGTLFFAKPEDTVIANQLNNNIILDEQPCEQPSCSRDTPRGVQPTETVERTTIQTSLSDKRVKWRREAISRLIALRSKYEADFNSTTTKNEAVWLKVAEDMKKKGYNMTSTQCNDKWRYLKSKYSAKKDNMKGSGQEPMDFEFFEEMDALLGKKHTIRPIAIASSARGNTMPPRDASNDIEEVLSDHSENTKITKKRKCSVAAQIKNKKTTVQCIMDTMKNSAQTREENRNRRHEELVNLRQNAIDVFASKINKFIAALKKQDEPTS